MEELLIRGMKETDSAEISALFSQCFSHPWTKEGILEMFAAGGYLSLVSEEAGKITGYIGMKTVLDEGDIVNVAVHPAKRKQGIGRKLLKALLKEAADAGIVHIFLEVRKGNQAAIALYEGAGFSFVGVRKAYYKDPTEDAMIFALNQ